MNQEHNRQMQIDQEYMRRALELAKKGMGFTAPNPMVGAVIVKGNKVIGEGYHEQYGKLHAERNALAALTEPAEGATMYVTLEPCCHYGKTPPCTEAIIEHRLSRVVVGSMDPNPLVAGKGVQILRENGITVDTGILEEECDKLNEVFMHYMRTGRPYVVMKYAMTADGKIATRTGASKWITGPKARQTVQEMRHRYRGIMVGIGTVLADDPLLTTRIEGLRSPVRIICDSRLRIPLDSQIVQTAKQYETIIACAFAGPEKVQKLESCGAKVLVVPPTGQEQVDLKELMALLGQHHIDSVLVEGGGQLNDSLRRSGLINKLEVFIAPKLFGGKEAKGPVGGDGVSLVEEAFALELDNVEIIDEDVRLTYERRDE